MPREQQFQTSAAYAIGVALRGFLAEHPEGVAERVIERAMVELAEVPPAIYHGVVDLYLAAGWLRREDERLVLST